MQNVVGLCSYSCPCATHLPRARRGAVSVAAVGQGFGSASAPAKTSDSGHKGHSKRKTTKQVVKEAASQKAAPGRKQRQAQPVSKEEAADGRIDYARVKDWGEGQPADLGELQVESFTPGLYADHSKPFYEQLARRLEDLQVRGMLNIAQPKSAKPLPPFEKWSFTEQRYIQYMCDQHNVHSALEEAVAAALRAGPAGPQPIEEVQASGECAAAFEALSCFGEDSGLDRSMQIARDLDSMAKASNITNRSISVKPTQQAIACCEYIVSLQQVAQEEPDEQFRQEAALRLMAMSYGVHVTHLTTGMRVGSAAAEKLNLFAADALNFYRSYPEASEPLKRFMSNVSSAGTLLTFEQQERVMNELPRAFPKISLLLTTLAYTT